MMLLKKMHTKNIEDKIPFITGLATNASQNAEINEVKTEIHSITNLTTTAALTTVENKIPNVSEQIMMQKYQR